MWLKQGHISVTGGLLTSVAVTAWLMEVDSFSFACASTPRLPQYNNGRLGGAGGGCKPKKPRLPLREEEEEEKERE